MRGTLVWDSSQEIIELGVDNKFTLRITVTGAHMTVMDVAMATKLGMKVYMAQNGDYGKYSVAGGLRLDYAGKVEKPVILRFGKGIVLYFPSPAYVSSTTPIRSCSWAMIC